jgi:hypothetical protein
MMTSLLSDVTVSGAVEALVVHNNATKTIVGYVLHLSDANSQGETRVALPYGLCNPKDFEIAPGSQFQLSSQTGVQFKGKGPCVNAILGAVLFDDGEVVGAAYEANLLFTEATDRLKSERDVYATLRIAGWDAVQQIASQSQPKPGASVTYNHFAQSAARELVNVRDKQNEAAAFALMEKNKNYPMPWRKQ